MVVTPSTMPNADSPAAGVFSRLGVWRRLTRGVPNGSSWIIPRTFSSCWCSTLNRSPLTDTQFCAAPLSRLKSWMQSTRNPRVVFVWAGAGARAGGAGGGGGAAAVRTLGADANGGDGAAGGEGGRGGGVVRICAWSFENYGIVHADGFPGEPGADAPDSSR